MLPPQVTQRPSLFFTLVLAFSFSAPGFSVIARQIFGTYAFLGINLVGQLSLLLVLISRSSKPKGVRKGLLFGSGLVCLVAIFSALAISETSGFSQIQKITVFGKSASLCSLFVIYRLTAHLFYEKELQHRIIWQVSIDFCWLIFDRKSWRSLTRRSIYIGFYLTLHPWNQSLPYDNPISGSKKLLLKLSFSKFGHVL